MGVNRSIIFFFRSKGVREREWERESVDLSWKLWNWISQIREYIWSTARYSLFLPLRWAFLNFNAFLRRSLKRNTLRSIVMLYPGEMNVLFSFFYSFRFFPLKDLHPVNFELHRATQVIECVSKILWRRMSEFLFLYATYMYVDDCFFISWKWIIY